MSAADRNAAQERADEIKARRAAAGTLGLPRTDPADDELWAAWVAVSESRGAA